MKAQLDGLLEQLADLVAERVVERLRAGEHAGWLDQSASSLGRRRHIEAVRRRVAARDTGAVQLGRRYLLSQAAHDEEMARLAGRPRRRTREADIADELGLRVVEGGR